MTARKGKALSVRIATPVYDALVARAKQNGRSITQETEQLLERALMEARIETRLDAILACVMPPLRRAA
jgi:hypothetical protein